MAGPTCPDCGEEGIEKIVCCDSKQNVRGRDPWFQVVHCDGCGHVYGVIAKTVYVRDDTGVVPTNK